MSSGYAEPSARARKIASTVMQHVHADRQTAIAAAIGVHESTVSRLLSDHLDKLAQVLAHAGLKVVPESYRCVDDVGAAETAIDCLRRLEPIAAPESQDHAGGVRYQWGKP